MKSISEHRIRLFQSQWLERFTVVSPQAFLIIWSLIISLIVWAAWGKASVAAGLGLVVAGLLGWSLLEYSLHRFLFHWNPVRVPFKAIIFIFHGNHHAFPGDPLRNLMPPIVSIPVNGLISIGAVVLLGHGGWWFSLGLVIGYVAYDLTHYACHQLPMKGKLARIIKRHHTRHHHAQQNGNYAFTGLVWDHLLGTRIKLLKD
jgi:sterol desaturase/sphingolipid hydroxylase (fatty acid hydroxylase superfamily)